MAEINVPFSFRGKQGGVHVTVRANDQPRLVGCDLLDPSLPADAAEGFPICTAEPRISLSGYAAACGWVQVVRSTDSSNQFEMDPLAVFRDLDTPFAFFGITPVLFDAPFRERRSDLVWKARAFLAGLPDGVMSSDVHPLAAFEWGFEVQADKITINEPKPLQLSAWDEHIDLMAAAHPRWSFHVASSAPEHMR